MTIDAAARAYAKAYETLSAETIPALIALCADDIRFKDPFSDVRGRPAVTRIFERMFKGLDAPRFTVRDVALSGNCAYLRWSFHFRRKGQKALWEIEGMSEVHFDAAGRVAAHIDHWDSGAQFYARLPIIGAVIRWIARRVGGH